MPAGSDRSLLPPQQFSSQSLGAYWGPKNLLAAPRTQPTRSIRRIVRVFDIYTMRHKCKAFALIRIEGRSTKISSGAKTIAVYSECLCDGGGLDCVDGDGIGIFWDLAACDKPTLSYSEPRWISSLPLPVMVDCEGCFSLFLGVVLSSISEAFVNFSIDSDSISIVWGSSVHGKSVYL